MRKIIASLLAFIALCVAVPAAAQVTISFHSFNGSVTGGLFGGRYPHTFIVLEGTLESTGEPVKENYGFTAEKASPAVLMGPVKHMIMVEKDSWLPRTNRHFTIPISDEKYYEVIEEVRRWRDHPGKYYDLNNRNCIHFVGRMGEIVGLQVDYPKQLMKKPRAWLNLVSSMNPDLGAPPIE